MSFFSAYTVFWYSFTFGLYLLAMGLGAVSCNKIFKAQGWEALWKVEMWLSFVGGMSVMIISIGQMVLSYVWIRNAFYNCFGFFVLLFVSVVMMIGFLTGLELPLLIRIAKDSGFKSAANRTLSADYFGSLVAGVIFPLCIASISLLTFGLSIALINLFIAVYIYLLYKK